VKKKHSLTWGVLASVVLCGSLYAGEDNGCATFMKANCKLERVGGGTWNRFDPLDCDQVFRIPTGCAVILATKGRQVEVVGPVDARVEDLIPTTLTLHAHEKAGRGLLASACNSLTEWLFGNGRSYTVGAVRANNIVEPLVPPLAPPPCRVVRQLLKEGLLVQIDDQEDLMIVSDKMTYPVRGVRAGILVPKAAFFGSAVGLVKHPDGMRTEVLVNWPVVPDDEVASIITALSLAEQKCAADARLPCNQLRAAVLSEAGCFAQAEDELESIGTEKKPWQLHTLQVHSKWTVDEKNWNTLERNSVIPDLARVRFELAVDRPTWLTLLAPDGAGDWVVVQRTSTARLARADQGYIEIRLDNHPGHEVALIVSTPVLPPDLRSDCIDDSVVKRLIQATTRREISTSMVTSTGYGTGAVRIDFEHVRK